MKHETPAIKIKDHYEKVYSKKLTDEEVVEYNHKIIKFFSLLIEIDRKAKLKKHDTHNN